jgi:hypothetical protein
MISLSDVKIAISELQDNDETANSLAVEILEYLVKNGNWYTDLCDCDFDAKDNCEDCTCGLAQFLILSPDEE